MTACMYLCMYVTCTEPLETYSRETSRVPPPKSYTKI